MVDPESYILVLHLLPHGHKKYPVLKAGTGVSRTQSWYRSVSWMCLVRVKANQGRGCCCSAQVDGSAACNEEASPSFASLGPEQIKAVMEVIASIHFRNR